MKKTCMVLLCLGVSTVKSQEFKINQDSVVIQRSKSAKRKIEINLSAGTTISQLTLGFPKTASGDLGHKYDEGTGFGYYLGASMGIPMNDKGLILEGGIKLIQLYGNGKATLNKGGAIDLSLKSLTLNLPVRIKQTFKISNISLYGKLGGYVGAIIDNSREESPDQAARNNNYIAATIKYNEYDGYKRIDYGLLAELGGYVFEKISINIAYNLGLQNLYNGTTYGTNPGFLSEDKYFRYITLGLTYHL